MRGMCQLGGEPLRNGCLAISNASGPKLQGESCVKGALHSDSTMANPVKSELLATHYKTGGVLVN
jgi:hypothetical protein